MSNIEITQKIDQLVFDCYVKSSDIILQGRRATVRPIQNPRDQILSYDSNGNFCSQTIVQWRKKLTSPLFLDIFLINDDSHPVLMERWKFSYTRREDAKDGRFSSVNRRIVTFLRTLYCFVRLLPGFQVLRMKPHIPILNFAIYNPDVYSPINFSNETYTYEFPTLNTPRGFLTIGVTYINTSVLQNILHLESVATLPEFSPSTSRRAERAGSYHRSSTAAIPIPCTNLDSCGSGSPTPTSHSYSRPSSLDDYHNRPNNSQNIQQFSRSGNYQQYSRSENSNSRALVPDNRRPMPANRHQSHDPYPGGRDREDKKLSGYAAGQPESSPMALPKPSLSRQQSRSLDSHPSGIEAAGLHLDHQDAALPSHYQSSPSPPFFMPPAVPYLSRTPSNSTIAESPPFRHPGCGLLSTSPQTNTAVLSVAAFRDSGLVPHRGHLPSPPHLAGRDQGGTYLDSLLSDILTVLPSPPLESTSRGAQSTLLAGLRCSFELIRRGQDLRNLFRIRFEGPVDRGTTRGAADDSSSDDHSQDSDGDMPFAWAQDPAPAAPSGMEQVLGPLLGFRDASRPTAPELQLQEFRSFRSLFASSTL